MIKKQFLKKELFSRYMLAIIIHVILETSKIIKGFPDFSSNVIH